jgi:hypothetical protein
MLGAVLGVLAAGMLAALALAVVPADYHQGAGGLPARIVRSAAERLPERLGAIREEEWLAELDALEGRRLLWSAGVYVAALRLGSRYRGERRAERPGGRFRVTLAPDVLVGYRRHPAIFLLPVGAAAAELLSGVVVSVTTGASPYLLAIWLPWLVQVIWLGRRTGKWLTGISAITAERLTLPARRARRDCVISRGAISEITLKRSPLGRSLGYGTLIIRESDQVLHVARFVPYLDAVIKGIEECRPRQPPA